MQTDLFGKKRYKVNLHMHTNMSDGRKTPEEAIRLYKANGYDALALADHWVWNQDSEFIGVTLLSGAEYNCGGSDAQNGVFHILALGCQKDPAINKYMDAQEMIDAIHQANGLAILAHPAWSLNTPQQILALNGIDAVEIYNSTSACHHSRRPDSSLIVDMLATEGRYYPLIAADDTHYYDGKDDCKAFIMVEAEDLSPSSLKKAIKKGNFYATQGPEVHLTKEGNEFVARTSPVSSIVFLSNYVWSKRGFEGNGITEARYTPREGERFIRVVVEDKNGKQAWSNMIPIE